MGSVAKLETEVKIKSPAQKFFDQYRAKAHIVPKTSCHHNLHSVEVHEGDHVSSGSVKQWTYNLEGKTETIKGKIEADEENMKVTSTAVEGEILKQYKTFKVILQVVPKVEGSLVKWTWEYEKVDERVPEPKKFMDLAINLTKDVDSYIVNHMGPLSKLETEVEIKSSADQFFKAYRAKAHLVTKTATDHNIHTVEVHEGDFETSESIKQWTFKLDGQERTIKGKTVVDEENKKVTSTAIEGDVLEIYKSFQVTLQVFPKEDGSGSLVKWSWEYEKVHDQVPDPKKFLDLAANITKDVDAHILDYE